MTPIHEMHEASTLAQEDFISSMPDNVITNILDRLPLQDAVSTDILSKTWRFKWTMLSHLVFDENFFDRLTNTQTVRNHVSIISRFFLHLRGAITKFVLSTNRYGYTILDGDISHWILFLSRKGIQDLTLEHFDGMPFKIPSYLFSCLELKHLKLRNCCCNPPSTFPGFPNLLSLELSMQFGDNCELGKLITRCPLLEILKLDDVELVVFAKLENLKVLSLPNCDVNTMTSIHSSGNIFEFLCSIPKLQELELDFQGCELKEGGAGKSFPAVKALKLLNIRLDNDTRLSRAFELISSFPNLLTIEMTVNDQHDASSAPQVDYNTMGTLQLRSARFTYLKGSDNEICLMRYLLACSPLLQEIIIHPHESLQRDMMLVFSTKLLKLQRSFPLVDIGLY